MGLKEKYGEWALITGASSGIGLEFAGYFASLKINLVITARRAARLEQIAAELSGIHNIEVIPLECDLSDELSIDKLIANVKDKEIGILVNNAGSGSNGHFFSNDVFKETQMVKLNCLAPTILSHKLIPPMVERKKGAVIFLGSVLAFQPSPLRAVYSATKSFNMMLGEALWWELKKYNVDVITVNPGGTFTEFDRLTGLTEIPGTRLPADVVKTTIKFLGKSPSAVDGFRNKLIASVSKILPRKYLVSLSGIINESLYKKRSG